ncbi:ABC transporter ATP-binding protein [Bacillus sp. Bva_UNVM-123]|uniref:ABC transporter ATP-binding protein n=1 Tax=Bacillus sp. Bva_UNVM-123 TaxID=2829798 RepID=UPI00391EE3D4
MEPIVLLNNVTKEFKNKKAVDEVSFSIKKGEVVAILGPNGAGKTTTIMMMLGLLEPTSGNVQIFNKAPKDKEVRERIGAMLQEVSVIDGLKVREVIQLFRSYYPHPVSFNELIKMTGLNEEDLNKRAHKLSGGQKRRLSFALAMAGNPDLLFFDEPTVGLDIASRKLFWETVQKLKEQGKTIIFSTHYLQEADDVAERIILFHNGSIIKDGTPKEIKAKLTKKTVSFQASSHLSVEEFEQIAGVSQVYIKHNRIYLEADNTDAVLAVIFSRNMNISGIQVESGRLEEAFEQLTGKREAI